MQKFNEKNNNFRSGQLAAKILLRLFVVGLFLAAVQNVFASSSAFSGDRMLNITWNVPEQGADHYRLEITRNELNNKSASESVCYVYTKSNNYQMEIENDAIYSIRTQSVDAYGVFSNFSEETTFVINTDGITSKIVSLNDTLPMEFSVAQNYPNPFNPVTTISYTLPKNMNVKLTIYNITGQKVTELQSGLFEAGVHNVVWDASDMPSGTYFYTINTNEYSQSNKMLLLK
ncbi:MAG: T9SS type A sorting domain-containing protein [Candidatus Latescibacteria bacterium]|nr:T9SS type A sorting domain-containing protein [Candidatus Latescibacterota bacterium]